MLIGSIEDEKTSIKFTVFPSDFKELKKNNPLCGKLYLGYGSLNKDNKDEINFVLQFIKDIE